MRVNQPITQRAVSVPAGQPLVSRTDPEGRITHANHAFCQVSGFAEAELLGQNHNIVRHPDMPPAAFADLWATIWSEHLRIIGGNYAPQATHVKAADVFQEWIRTQMRSGRPLNEFVADMVASSGSNLSNGPANLYTMLLHQVRVEPKPLAADFSQLFLGVQIQCAECHNHPFDRWTMDDYYGLVSFFSCVKRKPGSDGRDRRVIFDPTAPPAKHAVDGRPVPAKLLGAVEPVGGEGDPRRALAAWIRDPENSLFNRNIVNRLWAHLLGVGIVDPVDDFRATNPPANGPLLDALAAKFVEHGRKLRPMIRDICNSRVYQLSVEPTPSGAADTRQYSHAMVRRLRADVLVDSVVAITGVPKSLPMAPTGTKAINYLVRNQYYQLTGDFVLDTFGQSGRKSVCACDTKTNPSLSQVMHLFVGDTVRTRAHTAATSGVLKKILDDNSTPERIIEAIFIRVLSRRPTSTEMQAMIDLVANNKAPAIYEDIFAGLFTTSDFLFNH